MKFVKPLLFGVGALLFGLMIFYLANPRFFGEHFIHFGGSVRQLEPIGDGKLLVIERVQTGGGEDGPITVGDRWRLVEAATGKPLAGPHYVDEVYWAAMSGGDRFVLAKRGNLEVRGLDNALIADILTFPNGESLRRDASDLSMGPDGRITALSNDGRFYVLDPHTLQSTQVSERVRGPRATASSLGRTSVKGFSFEGHPRAQVNRQGPDYLEPSLVQDPATDGPISAPMGGYVVLHFERLSDGKTRRGPMLSAVDASGAEAWRYKLPVEHLRSVSVAKGLLVLAVDEDGDVGPASLRAIDLTGGHEVWKLDL